MEDITPVMASQRLNVCDGLEALVSPAKRIYLPAAGDLACFAGIDPLE